MSPQAPGSNLDHGQVLRCQPVGDLGPGIRRSTVLGSNGLIRDHYIRKSVTNHGFSDVGEISRGAAEIVQQHVRHSILAHLPDHLSLRLALSFDRDSFRSGLFLSLPVTSPTSVTNFLV